MSDNQTKLKKKNDHLTCSGRAVTTIVSQQQQQQKKRKRKRERERERKGAKDKISISALLKGIFGMWCLSGFIFVFDVGCFFGFIFEVSRMLDLLLLISRHISEIRNYLW